jgi:Protein of unknown function (DUF4242)
LLRRRPRPSVGWVTEYMVERYLPGTTPGQLDEASARLAAASEELAANGVQVQYLGSTFVPDEESCFVRFESACADDVRRACERAGVSYARILETRDFAPLKEEQ